MKTKNETLDLLQDGERMEDLQCDGLKIIQNKNLYTFTSDSVILANFVKAKKSDVCAEIGTGCGVISILVFAKNHPQKIVGFEIQKPMFELCEKNIKLNHLEKNIEIYHENAKNFEKNAKKCSFDVVFSNPPYFKVTNFDQKETKKIAKEEVCLNIEDLVSTASNMLRSGGSFYVCYSAERSCELIYSCHSHNLIVKEMFFTENGKGDVKLVFLRAVKDAKNSVKVFKNLVTNDKNGDYLDELKTKYFLKK